MKEIIIKLGESYKKLDNVISNIENIKEHIEFLKKANADYLGWEMDLNNYIRVKNKLEKQIDILNKASLIILGDEKWED